MNLDQFLNHYWMLTERARTWLQHNPDRFIEFTLEFEVNPTKHVRPMTYDEDWAIKEVEYKNVPNSVEAITHRTLIKWGSMMADAMLNTPNHHGFMRKYFT